MHQLLRKSKVEIKQVDQQEHNQQVKTKAAASDYSKEFREQIIEIYNSGVYESAAECARNYQIPEKFLYHWLNISKKSIIPVGQNIELAKLRKEIATLKMENEILKKATVYFAKQMK